MVWRPLDTITVTEDWNIGVIPVFDAELFRLTHRTTADSTINSCYLTRYFVNFLEGWWSPWRIIYPSDVNQIIEIPVPRVIRERPTMTGYVFAVKWRFPYAPIPWSIDFEYWE